MLIPLVISAALAAADSSPLVELPGAQPVACGAAVMAVSEPGASPACFTIGAGRSFRLKLASPDRRSLLNAWRYAIRPLDGATATVSGQHIDGVGRAEWQEVLTLPGSGKQTTYQLSLGIESGHRHAERTLYIENAGRSDRASSWAIAGASIRLAPEGCWREVPDVIMALSLEACADKARSIKAVVVKPVDGLTLGQYVTNSVEGYSRAGIWYVKRREPVPAALGEGEVLELVQTIAGDARFIVKYFVRQQDRLLIVSRYGPVNQPIDTNDTSWLVVSAPD